MVACSPIRFTLTGTEYHMREVRNYFSDSIVGGFKAARNNGSSSEYVTGMQIAYDALLRQFGGSLRGTNPKFGDQVKW